VDHLNQVDPCVAAREILEEISIHQLATIGLCIAYNQHNLFSADVYFSAARKRKNLYFVIVSD